MTNSTFRQLVEAAFHRKTGTLDGLKGWMESRRYDIEGTAPSAAGFDDELLFTFKYDPEDSAGVASGTSVFAALGDQLGLRLERRKAPMELMVIDSADEPPSSEN